VTVETIWPELREQLRDPIFAPWIGFGAPEAQLPVRPAPRNELKSVETEIKYAGYLDQQKKAIEKLKKAEERGIPGWFDYTQVSGLSREMQEKLTRVRPSTLGQASRIPGVTPAALTLVNVYIEIQGKRMRETTV
jgi:tRNA uridine 5-carboxymethylaminomethyl modification enzyme